MTTDQTPTKQYEEQHHQHIFSLLPRRWWKVKSSAICAFSLDNIESYFNGSRFHNGQIEYYSSGGTDTGSKSTLQPGQVIPLARRPLKTLSPV